MYITFQMPLVGYISRTVVLQSKVNITLQEVGTRQAVSDRKFSTPLTVWLIRRGSGFVFRWGDVRWGVWSRTSWNSHVFFLLIFISFCMLVRVLITCLIQSQSRKLCHEHFWIYSSVRKKRRRYESQRTSSLRSVPLITAFNSVR